MIFARFLYFWGWFLGFLGILLVVELVGCSRRIILVLVIGLIVYTDVICSLGMGDKDVRGALRFVHLKWIIKALETNLGMYDLLPRDEW